MRNQRGTRDSGNRQRTSNRAARNVDEDLKVIEEGAKGTVSCIPAVCLSYAISHGKAERYAYTSWIISEIAKLIISIL